MATSGRYPPDQIIPSALHPVPSAFRPSTQYNIHTTPAELIAGYKQDPSTRPPQYLPQPEDYYPAKLDTMGPLDTWATGRPDYSMMADMTGTRPVVDKYSITRYSEGEWRKHNQFTLLKSHHDQNKSEEVEWFALKAIDDVMIETDKNQSDNSKRLKQREREIFRWKAELHNAADLMREEIELIEVQKIRLKKSLMLVVMPASIAGECINMRTGRLDIELVRDHVENELTRELSLSNEIRSLLERTLREVENQLIDNRSAKHRLEFDWSDKYQAHELAVTNSALNNRSTSILFNPGAATFQSEQSSVELWDRFVRDLIEEAERIRCKSVALRSTLDGILMNAARDLRTQADTVDLELSKRIATTEGVKQQLEIEMKKILRRQLDAENLMPKLKDSIRRLDTPMKVAQTRLQNKSYRIRVEQCRDPPQYGLIEEVKILSDSASRLRAHLKEVEENHARLLQMRSELEKDILLKRNSLQIDRGLLTEVRSHYPSANALSGYID